MSGRDFGFWQRKPTFVPLRFALAAVGVAAKPHTAPSRERIPAPAALRATQEILILAEAHFRLLPFGRKEGK